MKTAYITRQLVATREFAHGDRHLQPGESFAASQLDSQYYLDRRMAREPEAAPTAQPTAAAAPVVPAAASADSLPASVRRGPGRPPRARSPAPEPTASQQLDEKAPPTDGA